MICKEIFNELPMEFVVEARKRHVSACACSEQNDVVIKNLTVAVEGKTILHGLDLDVRPGGARDHGPNGREKHAGARAAGRDVTR